jgi:hypothetical protein
MTRERWHKLHSTIEAICWGVGVGNLAGGLHRLSVAVMLLGVANLLCACLLLDQRRQWEGGAR